MSLLRRSRRRLADVRGRGAYAGWPDANRAIFIHIPKTAGTSVSRQLGMSTSRHVPANEYRETNPQKFRDYFKFCFVRNPFDRLVSSYAFLRKGGMNANDARFADIKVKPFDNFEHFVTSGFALDPEIRRWVHFRPQTEFVCDRSGSNTMDFTGRFERISQDYASIAQRLDKPKDLPVSNKSQRGDYREEYTTRMIDIVTRFYVSDLSQFGYNFD